MAELEVEGLEPIIAGLEKARPIMEQEVRRASDAILFFMVAFMKPYPPQRPNSSYRRTKTLGRTWAAARPTFAAQLDGFVGRISNATPYGPDVQAALSQARVHRGRWQTDEMATEAGQPVAREQYEAALDRVAVRIENGG